MQRILFIALVAIALGTACTPEQQCQQIAIGSPSAKYGTFTPCYFATLNGSSLVGCFNGSWEPNGFDAGAGAVCQDAVFEQIWGGGPDDGAECTFGPEDGNGDACVIWESGGKVIATEWADFF